MQADASRTSHIVVGMVVGSRYTYHVSTFVAANESYKSGWHCMALLLGGCTFGLGSEHGARSEVSYFDINVAWRHCHSAVGQIDVSRVQARVQAAGSVLCEASIAGDDSERLANALVAAQKVAGALLQIGDSPSPSPHTGTQLCLAKLLLICTRATL